MKERSASGYESFINHLKDRRGTEGVILSLFFFINYLLFRD